MEITGEAECFHVPVLSIDVGFLLWIENAFVESACLSFIYRVVQMGMLFGMFVVSLIGMVIKIMALWLTPAAALFQLLD